MKCYGRSFDWRDIRNILENAKVGFLDGEQHLFSADVNERSMTHKFAEYLQPLFDPLNVDCEYNRQGRNKKALPFCHSTRSFAPRLPEDSRVYPDIIVHTRGTNHNVLVIEAKKSTSAWGADIAKLRAFLANRAFKYQFAVAITFVIGANADIHIRRVVPETR